MPVSDICDVSCIAVNTKRIKTGLNESRGVTDTDILEIIVSPSVAYIRERSQLTFEYWYNHILYWGPAQIISCVWSVEPVIVTWDNKSTLVTDFSSVGDGHFVVDVVLGVAKFNAVSTSTVSVFDSRPPVPPSPPPPPPPVPPAPPPDVFTLSVTPTEAKTGALTQFTLVYYNNGVVFTNEVTYVAAYNDLVLGNRAAFLDARHFTYTSTSNGTGKFHMVFSVGQTFENALTNDVTFTPPPPPPPPPPSLFTVSITPRNAEKDHITSFTLVYYKNNVEFTDVVTNVSGYNELVPDYYATFQDARHFMYGEPIIGSGSFHVTFDVESKSESVVTEPVTFENAHPDMLVISPLTAFFDVPTQYTIEYTSSIPVWDNITCNDVGGEFTDASPNTFTYNSRNYGFSFC